MIWERGEARTVYIGNAEGQANDRWRILHPKVTPSKRWELYDTITPRWEGDWPTLKQAKAKAVLVEAQEARA